MTKKEYEALLEIRELIARGWIWGRNHIAGIGVCLVGAVNAVTMVPQDNTSSNKKKRNTIFKKSDWETRYSILCLLEEEIALRGDYSHLETWNDAHGKKQVLALLDELIRKHEPKAMEIGKPERQITVEPAEPVPGVKESPASEPLPAPAEPVAPEREKVPA